MFFDTHGHLDDPAFNEDRKETIQRTFQNGVRTFVNIGCDLQTSLNSIEFAKTYDWIYATVGLHPEFADQISDELLNTFEELAKEPKVVAIGEIGLDYYWEDNPEKAVQKEAFRKQIRLAKKIHKPIAIHDRDAHGDILQILDDEQAWENGGIFHCYSGSAETAKEIVKKGFYVSFSGTLTYKNAEKVRASCEVVPLDRLLIETDSPYLSPVPFRGKRNEPSHVINTGVMASKIKGVSVEELARITWENGCRVYNIEMRPWPGAIETEYIKEACK